MSDSHRSVTIERLEKGRYVARNERGAELPFGAAGSDEFTPTELLLVAIAGCTGADVDYITAKRAEPVSFVVTGEGDKIRDDEGNRMVNLRVTFTVEFPEGEDGDAARAVLPDAMIKSHDRLCTVSRTIEHGTTIESVIG
ncbi:MAG: OsmC family peroxiredoxin [Actinomycetales bacterium]|nr:OsmC family peroxiredoxin [Actinomycetales bacterium]